MNTFNTFGYNRSCPPSDDLLALAQGYFSFMAQTFPVMCLSDEFYFFPRAEEALSHPGSMESLERDTIIGATRRVGQWLGELDGLGSGGDEAGCRILSQSMAGFLREFEQRRVWQDDPTLYLKIPLIGLDHLLALESQGHGLEREWVRDRLRGIPGLIASGKRNLLHAPQPGRGAAIEMAKECARFLRRSFAPWMCSRFGSDPELREGLEGAVAAVEEFSRLLLALPERPTFAVGEEILSRTLSESFGFAGSIGEVLELARDEEAKAQEALVQLARRIHPGETWRAIYDSIHIEGIRPHTVLDCYRTEVMGLEEFYRQADLVCLPPAGSVVVEETPLYLLPIRATASYCAPFPGLVMSSGRFFVTTEIDSQHGSSVSSLSALHRERRFLCAHETYPGHHVLDWNRIHLDDPIRRQSESALFYEGWACYGEQLTDEAGYQPDLCQSLIRMKRDYWRALRARLDIELHRGSLSLQQGAALLQGLGYTRESALKQVRRYTLTPGYQLCYTLGKREFLRLKKLFVPPLSLREFHSTVLGEGEVPFDCLEDSLKRAASRVGNR